MFELKYYYYLLNKLVMFELRNNYYLLKKLVMFELKYYYYLLNKLVMFEQKNYLILIKLMIATDHWHMLTECIFNIHDMLQVTIQVMFVWKYNHY